MYLHNNQNSNKEEFEKCKCGLDLKELRKGNKVCKCKKTDKEKKTYTSKFTL